MSKEHPKDHYVARTYLRPFTYDCDESYLYAYNKYTDEIDTKASVVNVACELDFHTMPSELVSEEDRRSLETLTQKLETQFAKDRDQLERLAETGGVVSNDLKRSLSEFIGMQSVRTRSHRDFTQAAIEIGIAQGQFRNPGEAWFKNGKMNWEYARFLHVQSTLNHWRDFAKVFEETEWILGVNDTQMLCYTSDDPVANVVHPTHPSPTGENVWYTLPITPNLILQMFPPMAKHEIGNDQMRHITDENIIKHYNFAQIAQSHVRIFSRTDHTKFCHEFCRKYPMFRNPQRPAQQGKALINAPWVQNMEIVSAQKSRANDLHIETEI